MTAMSGLPNSGKLTYDGAVRGSAARRELAMSDLVPVRHEYEHESPFLPLTVNAEPPSMLLREALAKGTVAAPIENVAFPTDDELDHRRADDRAIKVAIGALRDGRKLIDLDKVAESMDSLMWRFAVAPAHRNGKHLERELDRRTGDVTFSCGRWRLTFSGLSRPEHYDTFERYMTRRTIVPYVPPAVREQFAPLKGKLIVWEARWPKDEGRRIRMHIDPALIEPISGSLYSVVAVWDLTPLERAALGG